MWKAIGGCGGPGMGIEGFCGYEGPQISVKELGWVWRGIWMALGGTEYLGWVNCRRSGVREEGLGLSAPTQSPSHQFQALCTHLRSSIPILDPHTFPWRFTNTLDPPHQSQALLIYPLPYIPIPDIPYPP